MAALQQIQNNHAIYMGWYGTCDNEDCVDYSLTSTAVRGIIYKVFQIAKNPTNDGYVAFDGTIDPSLDSTMQPFTKLECGKSYIISLKPGLTLLFIISVFTLSTLCSNIFKFSFLVIATIYN